jgi:hypothetical protein
MFLEKCKDGLVLYTEKKNVYKLTIEHKYLIETHGLK